MHDSAEGHDFRMLAELVIDVAREIQLRAIQTTPVVPLTPTQGQIMRFVHRNPGCSASDIADGAGLQRANVSAALRELRGRGYLTSRRDDVDGRAIRIDATPLADATIDTLQASWADLVGQAWAGGVPNGADLEAVIDGLSRVRSGLHADHATKTFPAGAPAAAARVTDSSVAGATLR